MTTSLAIAILGAAANGTAQDEKPDQEAKQLAELKARMKARFADVSRLQTAEKVGETDAGLVEVVKPADAKQKLDPQDKASKTIGDLLTEENADRAKLYELLAKSLKLTAAQIAKQNALRNLENAKPSHWYKLADRGWVQRKNIETEKDKEKKREAEKKQAGAAERRPPVQSR
jgi:uncharacterized protein YdbL (DUF1318 family)